MIRYFTKAFKITNENIILATPMVLFLFLLSIYLGIAQNAPENILAVILLLITTLFMISAFFAGWFHMVKKAIELDKKEFIIDEDKAKASFGLIKELPLGIGEYFLSFVGGFIFYTFLLVLFAIAGYLIGEHFIGKIGISLVQIKSAFESAAAMKALIASLSAQQLEKLNAWNLLIMGLTSFYSFITMFWAASILYKSKNPLVAFFQSISFTFKNFLSAVILFIYISFINFTISLLNAVAMINPIVYFVSMLVYFYFVVYIVVLVFLYYDRENDKKSDSESEDNCLKGDCPQDSCNSGSDSVGQNDSGDSESQRD